MYTLIDKMQYLYDQVPAEQRDIIMEALAEIDALGEELDTERRRLAKLDEEIARLQKDAARYQWLKLWNKTDGFNDESIDRERAIDMAVNAAIVREEN